MDPEKSHVSGKTTRGNPIAGGRSFHSLAEARRAHLTPGDVILLRDMAEVARGDRSSLSPTRGKWRLRPYRLENGETGRLLWVDDRDKERPDSAVPPDLELGLDLPGWYAIEFGFPWVEARTGKGIAFSGGVDVALDTDPAFVFRGVERGTRHGRTMGGLGFEATCFWKCARLDGRALRLRVPYGTYVSFPWGLIRASLSSIRLVRLSGEQADEVQAHAANSAAHGVIVVDDGFSHYWFAGEPGKGIDARFVQQYRDSDVKRLFFQTPATGVASWPSRVTSLLGEGVTDEEWKLLRLGDRRAHDYIQWAVRHGEEGFRVMSRLAREAGLELHASLRMNLFFRNGGIFGNGMEAFFNGRFWREHPELRYPPNRSAGLDYGLPGARQFASDLLVELASLYDLDGINLDFTRWPPVIPAHHSFEVATGLVHEIRQALDRVEKERSRSLALSACVVDGYHAHRNLLEQRIDLEAWLASGDLDFICVQAWEHEPHLRLAKRFDIPYYAVQENTSIRTPGGYRDDPEWRQEEKPDEDPLPGEELEEQPRVNSGLDPIEYDEAALARYRQGADGLCLFNTGGWFPRRLGRSDEIAERMGNREVWAQREGPGIRIDGS